MVSFLIFPFFSGIIDRTEEKREISYVLNSINDLKKKSFSYVQNGKISASKNQLIFSIGGKEIEKISLKGSVTLKKDICFNKNGLTEGGEIVLKLRHKYKVIVEKLWGKIKLEKTNEG